MRTINIIIFYYLMKSIFRLLPLVVVALFALVACDTEPQVDGAKPTIDITFDEATAESLTFNVAIADAEQCAYMYVTGAASFDPETVIANGTPLAKDATSFTIEGLQSATTYYVVAAASNANGYTLSKPVAAKTLASGEQPDPDPDPDPDPNPDPELPFEPNIEILRSSKGTWYDSINYYVTLEATTGQVILLDLYTDPGLSFGKYIPEGRYEVSTEKLYYTIGAEYSGVKESASAEYGDTFKSGYLEVSLVDGQYNLVFDFTLDNATSQRVCGTYRGSMSGASVIGDEDLLTIRKITQSSFTFQINAPQNQEWRCVAIEKVTYDMYGAKPSAFLSTYGFPGVGPQEIVWANGEAHPNPDFAAQGVKIEVGPGMDYIVLVALYDPATASFASAVFEKVIHTLDAEESNATLQVTINDVGMYNVNYTIEPSSDVDYYRTCVLKTELVKEAEEAYYTAGFSSFEAFMIYLIESSASHSQKHSGTATIDWTELNYGTPYTICSLIVDKSGAKALSLVEFETDPRDW